jgi:hypothetical protein
MTSTENTEPAAATEAPAAATAAAAAPPVDPGILGLPIFAA